MSLASSVSLERRDIRTLDLGADDNQVLATSSFQTADGRTFQLGDVALLAELSDCGCRSSGLAPMLFNAEGGIS